MVRRLSTETEVEIIRLYGEGLSGEEIGRRVGHSGSACIDALRRNGVEVPAGPRHKVNHYFFSDVSTEVQAYVLGLWSADGNVSSTINCCSISLQRDDEAVLEAIRQVVEYTGPLHRLTSVDKSSGTISYKSRLAVHSSQWKKDLINYGVTPRKSGNLQPWHGPDEIMNAYWRGMVDGNGGWPARDNRILCQFTHSLAVVTAFRDFVKNRCGYHATILSNGSIYQVYIHPVNVVQSLVSHLYDGATIWMERKRVAAEAILARPPVPPKKSWGHLTADGLLALYEEQGRWNDVARHIGMPLGSLMPILYRLGIKTRNKKED
jgi:hypothetical protein